jgi:hypothetical protein
MSARLKMKPSGDKRPTLKRAPYWGGETHIYYDSVLRAAGIDPATQPPDRPLIVTKAMAAKLLSKSPRTIVRMVADGLADRAAEAENTAA